MGLTHGVIMWCVEVKKANQKTKENKQNGAKRRLL